VTVNLSGPGGPLSTTTDGTGKYQFTGLMPGTYTVSVVAPAGYVATKTGQGTAATDSNASPSGTTPSFLQSGGSDQTIDFGFYIPVKIGDFVWNDLNGDGVQDAGEPGIAGVTVNLSGPSGPMSTTTDGTGKYQFTGLMPGIYTVSVVAPAGYVATKTGQGTAATDSNASPSGTTPSFLVSGAVDETIDFGFYIPVKIGDFVWNDLDGNGVQIVPHKVANRHRLVEPEVDRLIAATGLQERRCRSRWAGVAVRRRRALACLRRHITRRRHHRHRVGTRNQSRELVLPCSIGGRR